MSGKKWNARNDQRIAARFVLNNPKAGLFMDMGLGKTVVSLTVMQLLLDRLEVSKPLVIAPKRVVESVWLQEVGEWQHLDLKGVRIVGDAKQRLKALQTKADFYLISVDNVVWLVDHYLTAFPFDMVIIDESSKFKSHDSQRFRALKRVIKKVERVIILTGTPAPNGLIDLWSQLYLLDGGQRLEPMISHYRDKYFNHNQYKHRYELKQDADKVISTKIKDICISISNEHLKDLPDLIVNDIKIMMDSKLERMYKEFKREQVLLLVDKEITAFNAPALMNKLLQFANGAVYDSEHKWHRVHDLKLDALEDVIEEANGNNILCAYNYQHDLERILKRFKGYARLLKNDKDVVDWNSGKIPFAVMHPASGGHGLNLQHGGHIAAHFGLNANLEWYQQFNKRIQRPGQKENKVILHRLLLNYTEDIRMAELLAGKTTTQKDLIDSVKIMVDEVLNN